MPQDFFMEFLQSSVLLSSMSLSWNCYSNVNRNKGIFCFIKLLVDKSVNAVYDWYYIFCICVQFICYLTLFSKLRHFRYLPIWFILFSFRGKGVSLFITASWWVSWCTSGFLLQSGLYMSCPYLVLATSAWCPARRLGLHPRFLVHSGAWWQITLQ